MHVTRLQVFVPVDVSQKQKVGKASTSQGNDFWTITGKSYISLIQQIKKLSYNKDFNDRAVGTSSCVQAYETTIN